LNWIMPIIIRVQMFRIKKYSTKFIAAHHP